MALHSERNEKSDQPAIPALCPMQPGRAILMILTSKRKEAATDAKEQRVSHSQAM